MLKFILMPPIIIVTISIILMFVVGTTIIEIVILYIYRIRIYSWKTLKPLAYLSYHTQTINTVDFSEDLCDHGQLLAAGGKDSRISLWSLYNEK